MSRLFPWITRWVAALALVIALPATRADSAATTWTNIVAQFARGALPYEAAFTNAYAQSRATLSFADATNALEEATSQNGALFASKYKIEDWNIGILKATPAEVTAGNADYFYSRAANPSFYESVVVKHLTNQRPAKNDLSAKEAWAVEVREYLNQQIVGRDLSAEPGLANARKAPPLACPPVVGRAYTNRYLLQKALLSLSWKPKVLQPTRLVPSFVWALADPSSDLWIFLNPDAPSFSRADGIRQILEAQRQRFSLTFLGNAYEKPTKLGAPFVNGLTLQAGAINRIWGQKPTPRDAAITSNGQPWISGNIHRQLFGDTWWCDFKCPATNGFGKLALALDGNERVSNVAIGNVYLFAGDAGLLGPDAAVENAINARVLLLQTSRADAPSFKADAFTEQWVSLNKGARMPANVLALAARLAENSSTPTGLVIASYGVADLAAWQAPNPPYPKDWDVVTNADPWLTSADMPKPSQVYNGMLAPLFGPEPDACLAFSAVVFFHGAWQAAQGPTAPYPLTNLLANWRKSIARANTPIVVAELPSLDALDTNAFTFQSWQKVQKAQQDAGKLDHVRVPALSGFSSAMLHPTSAAYFDSVAAACKGHPTP
ncbi:MAG TPA: hypothetical protein VGO67_04920 [Verrucomicrobiae bacterium]|jgi:hypothetical protein